MFPPTIEYVLNGVLFALIAGIGMMMRIKLGEGHYIDGRIILVGMSAAYVHPIAGVVSAILVSCFRMMMGGAGVGIPENMDWKNSKTLGLKLVRNLVKNQLDGSIDMESKGGTKFTIKFNTET